MEYRFPKWKDASFNSFERQKERYEVLRPYLGSGQVGAEIGVYKGGFGEFLLEHCSKLFLVDCWYLEGGFWNTPIENDSKVGTVIDILRVYKKEIEEGRIQVIIDYSENFLRSRSENFFDFLYIDGAHKYEPVLQDLTLAHSKLKPGGRLFGDDYDPNPTSRQHGVYQAVNKFAKDHNGRMIVNRSRQWGLAFD